MKFKQYRSTNEKNVLILTVQTSRFASYTIRNVSNLFFIDLQLNLQFKKKIDHVKISKKGLLSNGSNEFYFYYILHMLSISSKRVFKALLYVKYFTDKLVNII